MNQIHEANRQHWNSIADQWKERRDRDGLWRRCHKEPELVFEGGVLELIRESVGDIRTKDVCIIGSGDNLASFALAGLGARVTSTDVSDEQLHIASSRADQLDLSIAFIQSDAADLQPLHESSFDLVCSTNGFFVWISDLGGVFEQVYRILRPGGFYIFCDIHPFLRPWKDQVTSIEIEKPYWDTGPFQDSEEGPYYFHWTVADLLTPLSQAGLVLSRMIESPAADSRFWQGTSLVPGTDDSLLDWTRNPLAGLPVWLTVAAQRPSNDEKSGTST